MSFNWYARKARDPRLSIWTRRAAFHSCIRSYCWLTRQPYLPLRTEFNQRFALDHAAGPTDQSLHDAMSALERDRTRFLQRLRAFERTRIREKAQGRRRPRVADIQAPGRGPA